MYQGCGKKFAEKGNMKTHFKTHFKSAKRNFEFDLSDDCKYKGPVQQVKVVSQEFVPNKNALVYKSEGFNLLGNGQGQIYQENQIEGKFPQAKSSTNLFDKESSLNSSSTHQNLHSSDIYIYSEIVSSDEENEINNQSTLALNFNFNSKPLFIPHRRDNSFLNQDSFRFSSDKNVTNFNS